MPVSWTMRGAVYAVQAPSAPIAYSILSTPEPASVASTVTEACPMYAPSAFFSPSAFAEVSGAVVSSPPASVTVRVPCIGPWPGMVQW